MENFFTYSNSQLEINADNGDFITILGPANERIVSDLLFQSANNFISIENEKITDKNIDKLRKTVNFAIFDMLDIFVAETVRDEIASGMENLGKSKRDMEHFLSRFSSNYELSDYMDRDPYSLGISDKVKLKIVSALACECNVLVLCNVLESLDYDQYVKVKKLLNDYTKLGNVVLNFTTNINDTLFGNKVVITDEEKVLISGRTLSVLNEERLLKRLKIGLPFITEINKYLIDYKVIDKYYLDYGELVDEIWK